MTTVEKIERMDELMEKYGVNDVYSLIEAMEKESYPELARVLQKGTKGREMLNELRNSYGSNLFHSNKDVIGDIFSELKEKGDGKLYYISIKEMTEEERASGVSGKCLVTGNLFYNERDAEKVLETIFKGE